MDPDEVDRDGNPFTHEYPACKASKTKEKGADESDYDYSQRSIIEYRYSAHAKPNLVLVLAARLWLQRADVFCCLGVKSPYRTVRSLSTSLWAVCAAPVHDGLCR